MESKALIIGFLIQLLIYSIIILILEYYRVNGSQCGIPVVFWIEFVFILLLVQSAFALN
jgi:hypothetical protein